MIECSLFQLSNFSLMRLHPLLILFCTGLSVTADVASELQGGECSEAASLCTRRAWARASLQLRARSTAALSPCLGSPSMQVCPTRPYCCENLCFRLDTFLLYLFLSLAGYIFKGNRGTEWNTSILPFAALGRRPVISLWGRGGEGRAANFPGKSGTAWERKCREKRRKIT